MTPATRTLFVAVIRALKGVITALETWLESQRDTQREKAEV